MSEILLFIANIVSFGAVRKLYTDRNYYRNLVKDYYVPTNMMLENECKIHSDYNTELVERLQHIIRQDTPYSNATVKRMVKIAKGDT